MKKIAIILTVVLLIQTFSSPVYAQSEPDDFDEFIYVGTESGLILKVNSSNGNIADTLDPYPSNNNRISDIKTGPNGYIYSTHTLDPGIYQIDPNTMTVNHSFATSTDFTSLEFYNGFMYAGDLDGNVYKFDINTKTLNASNSVTSSTIYAIGFSDGRGYAGGSNFNPGGQLGEFNATTIANPNTITVDETIYYIENSNNSVYTSGYWGGGGTGVTTNFSLSLTERNSVNEQHKGLRFNANGNLVGATEGGSLEEIDTSLSTIQTTSLSSVGQDVYEQGALVYGDTHAYGGSSLTLVDYSSFSETNDYSLTSYTITAIADTSTIRESFEQPERSLTLEVVKWMPFNSTEKYTATLTNETGEYDVSSKVTINSNNTNIVKGDENNVSIKSFEVTGRTYVNATYNGLTSNNTNITVGNRNLSNIGIMPPGQYINSFLGVDNTDSPHNIGSDTQWLIFIIIVTAAFGKTFENDWAGLGLGLMTAIMLWVVEFVGLGMILSITFFIIFVGTLKLRVNNGGSNGGDVNVNVESRDFNQ